MRRWPDHARPGRAAIVLVTLGVLVAGCGSADPSDATPPTSSAPASTVGSVADGRPDLVTLSQWVHQFDEVCVGIGASEGAAGSAMSDIERTAFTAGAVAVLRALRPPDEMADTAAELLDLIEAGQQPDVDDAAMADIDQQLLATMHTLGVSDECVGGAPAE